MVSVDTLNRKEFVEKVFAITESISNKKENISFAIDGKWGCGKSFVLNMLEDRLNNIQSEETNKNKYIIIRYNCWKYDYYDEPIIAIVSTLLDEIDEKIYFLPKEKRDKVKGVLKAIGVTLLSTINGAIKHKTGVDLKVAYDIVSNGMSSGKKEYEKTNSYNKYFAFKESLKGLQNLLNELSEEYTIVFLVDEVDRCLPEYAVKVLERLHHIMEGTNSIINIISMDKGQLKQSIQQIFGITNVEKYLKKFISFTVELDLGVVSEKIIEKHSEYIELFDKNIFSYDWSMEEFYQQIFKNIDVREQEKLISKIMIAHKILFNEKKDYSFMCIELLTGIMFSYYSKKRKFCKWFDAFWGTIEDWHEKPSFTNFFETKFNQMDYSHVQNMGGIYFESYRLQDSKDIYSAIAYIWIKLFIGEHRETMHIDAKDSIAKGIWNKNIEELREFSELLAFIE